MTKKEAELKRIIKETNKKYDELVKANKDYLEKKTEYEERIKKYYKEKDVITKNDLVLKTKRVIGLEREKAILFDDNGFYITTVNIKPKEETFSYEDNEYVIKRDYVASRFKIKRLLEKEIFYFYNINNTTPITLSKPPIVNQLKPKEFHSMLHTKQLINLNKATSMLSGLFSDPKKLLLIAGAGVVAYLLLSGGLA